MNQVSYYDSFLIRCPLAGLNLRGYNIGYRGEATKALSIVTRLGAIALGILLITHTNLHIPPHIANWSFIGLSAASFTVYALGSSEKREAKAIFYEFTLRSICITVSLLSASGILTQAQLGIAIVSTLSGGTLLATFFEKDIVRRIEPKNQHPPQHVLPQETFEEHIPPLPLRIVDHAISFGRNITYTSGTLLSSMTHPERYSERIEDNPKAEALCVFIHGMKGRPCIFDPYYDAYKEHFSDQITFFQPYVKNRGDCSLEEAVEPLFQEIHQWALVNPGPILLNGISNGARIIGATIARLKLDAKIPNEIYVSCIAGPFLGTKIVDQPDWPTMLRKPWESIIKMLYCDAVYRELSWNSQAAQRAINRLRSVNTMHYDDVHFNFYSTVPDLMIQSFTSGCPKLDKNVRYHLTATEGHNSVVDAVRETIFENSLLFLESHGITSATA